MYEIFIRFLIFVRMYLRSPDISAWNLQYAPISRRRSTSPSGNRYKIDFTAFSRMTRTACLGETTFCFGTSVRR